MVAACRAVHLKHFIRWCTFWHLSDHSAIHIAGQPRDALQKGFDWQLHSGMGYDCIVLCCNLEGSFCQVDACVRKQLRQTSCLPSLVEGAVSGHA